tara:strand:+ start:5701 stop:5922 length:222 start_codon:yes stop_codon:yes gene_type:complete
MNYKIVNNNTGATYFLNEKEKTNFFIKNKVQNYNEINLTKERAKRRNKMLDVVTHLAIVAASILATLIYIQNY